MERAAALVALAEKDGPRLGDGERRLIMEYAEAVGDTDKVIELINVCANRALNCNTATWTIL